MKKIKLLLTLALLLFIATGCFGNDDKKENDNKNKEPDAHESGLVARMPVPDSAALFMEEKDVIGSIDAFVYETDTSVSELYDWYIEELEKSDIYTDIIIYGVTPNYFTLEVIFEEDGVEYRDGIQVTDLPDKIVEKVQIRFVTANPLK